MPLRQDETEPIEQNDLQQLIDDGEAEGQRLDYKRELPPAWNDAAKQELLSDASAFANASGGHLVFGIEQDDEGRAARIVPLPFNPDVDAMRIENMLRDGAEPRMPGLRVDAVQVEVEGKRGFVVLIYAPQSWVGPHRVRASRHFYVRDGRQSRPVDIPELRALFLGASSRSQQIHDFRTERLGKILVGESPYGLMAGPALVLHLVPLRALTGTADVDPVEYRSLRRQVPVLTSATGAASALVNLDGAAGARPMQGARTHGYTLLFRNGFVEGTWVLGSNNPQYRGILPGDTFERYISQFVAAARSEFRHWRVDGEAVVMLSILDASDVALGVPRDFAGNEVGKFDRKVLALPEVVLRGVAEAQEELKPLFDLVWQSAGFAGSPYGA